MIEGRVIRIGNDVDTDVILPGKYLNLTEPEELGRYLLEGYDPELGRSIAPGDVLVAGLNFGSGSSREQAPVAMLNRGVRAVIAESVARIFLRNAFNLGLPVIESPEAARRLAQGDPVRIALDEGWIELPGGDRVEIPAQPPFLADLVAAGGLVEWTRQRLEQRSDRGTP
jgi:3-isopropylmalate/(R)-2-methylmalate dehydratase small subunit